MNWFWSISMFKPFFFPHVSMCVQTERPTNAPHLLQPLHCTVGWDSSIFNVFLSIIHTPNLGALQCEGLLMGWDTVPVSHRNLSLSRTQFISLCIFLAFFFFFHTDGSLASVHLCRLKQLKSFFSVVLMEREGCRRHRQSEELCCAHHLPRGVMRSTHTVS